MNYTELQTRAQDYLSRTDLAAKMPEFVERAEAMLFRELSISDTQTSVTGTTSGGLITLPDDFKEVVRVTVQAFGMERELSYWKSPLDSLVGGDSPRHYALESNAIRLYPAPGDAYNYTLYYTPKLTPLSGAAPTNWLLENAPDLYLYATALEGAHYVRDAQTEQDITAMLPGMLESVRSLSKRRGLPSAGGLRVRPR